MTEPDKSVAYKTHHRWVAGFYWWCVIAAGGALAFLARALDLPWLQLAAKAVALVGTIGLVAFIVMEKVHIVAALGRMWKARKGREDS